MAPKRLNQFLDWLSGKTESPAVDQSNGLATLVAPPVAAVPVPVVIASPAPSAQSAPPAPPVPTPRQELRSFRALVAKHVDYATARRQALATTDELFQREERQWRAAVATSRGHALQACSTRISGEELNVVASNFASNALFATETHRFFDGGGSFGSAILGSLTDSVLNAELALGRQTYQHISWPQPYWTCHNLPQLDNRPPPLKMVATRQMLSFVKTTYSVDELTETIDQIEQQLLGRADQHRAAMRGFVSEAVTHRRHLLAQWGDQLARDRQPAADLAPALAQLGCEAS